MPVVHKQLLQMFANFLVYIPLRINLWSDLTVVLLCKLCGMYLCDVPDVFMCTLFANWIIPELDKPVYDVCSFTVERIETTSWLLSSILVTLSLISTECTLTQWTIALVVMSVYALLIAIISVTITIIDGIFVCYNYGIRLYIKERKSELCVMHQLFSQT